MLKIVAKMRIKEGCVDEVLQAARDLVPPTRAEAGNQSYELWQAANDSRTILFDEVWSSLEAWEEHVKTPHLKAFKAFTHDLLESSDVTACRPGM